MLDSQQRYTQNPVQIYMDRDHTLTAYYSQTEIANAEPEPTETYQTKVFLNNYVLIPTLASGGGYRGTVSVSIDYPEAHDHMVALSYRKMSDADVFAKLTVRKNGVTMVTFQPEDTFSHYEILDSNSNQESFTYTFEWISNQQISLQLDLSVSNWPASKLSIFGGDDPILGPLGIGMIVAGVAVFLVFSRSHL